MPASLVEHGRRLDMLETSLNQHARDDQASFSSTAKAIVEVGDRLTLKIEEVASTLSAQVTPLREYKIRAEGRAEGAQEREAEIKSAAVPSPWHLALVQGATGPVIAAIITLLAAGWASDHFSHQPNSATSTTTTTATVATPPR